MSSTTYRSRLGLGLGAALMLGATLSACGTTDAAPVSTKVADPALGGTNARSAVTYMSECMEDNLVQQPKTFTLTCGDGGMALEQLEWKNWGADQATATGVVSTNQCEPSCAEGEITDQKVTVTASDLNHAKTSARYTKLRVVAAEATQGKDGITDETFKLFGAAGAEAAKR